MNESSPTWSAHNEDMNKFSSILKILLDSRTSKKQPVLSIKEDRLF